MNSRLDRGLVFDDEIAAQAGMRIRQQFRKRNEGSEAAGNFREASRGPEKSADREEEKEPSELKKKRRAG